MLCARAMPVQGEVPVVKLLPYLGVSLAASTSSSAKGISKSYASGLSKALLTQAGQTRPARWPAFSLSDRRNCSSSREIFLRRWQTGVEHLIGILTLAPEARQ